MSTGLGLLHQLLVGDDSFSALSEAGVGPSSFFDDELTVFRFIEWYVEEFNQLPKVCTVEIETDVKFPQFPDEPFSYWLQVVKRRSQSKIVEKAIKELRAAVLDGNLGTARDVASQLNADLDSSSSTRNGNGIEIRTLAQIEATPCDERPQVISGVLYVGDSLLVTGPGGIGKTMLLLQFSLSSASGSEFLGRQTGGPYKVLLVQSEVGFQNYQDRLNRLCHDWSGRRRAALENIYSPWQHGSPQIAGALADRYGKPTDFIQQLKRLIELSEAQIVILDPLISFIGGDENDNAVMRRTLDILTGLCAQYKATPVVVHHHAKPSIQRGHSTEKEGYDKSRGASAITDWARCILTLTRIAPKNGDRKHLVKAEWTKTQGLRPTEPLTLELIDGGTFRVEGGLGPDNVRRLLEQRECQVVRGRDDMITAIQSGLSVSRDAARELLKDAIAAGVIVRERDSGDNQTMVYTLPNETDDLDPDEIEELL